MHAGSEVATVLFWVGWFIALFGGGIYSWRRNAGVLYGFGSDILLVLLVGLLGYHVFPFSL